ncbi:MAG: 23S rRNA (uracil(1939)-C(5))-methyltransferase RlmD [Lachnospiraceae bacterium]|nr:23S rRNA (uracil(1939)-C(5))-methyltransferase RlmD [Lachnospiraceae bacterium]
MNNSKNNKEQGKCPYFAKCGGCSYINKTYEEQLDIKQQNVSKYLKDIASSQGIKIEKIIGTEQPYYYRNKVHSVFALDAGGKPVRGIYSEKSHRVVSVKGCMLEDKKADEIIEEVYRLLPSFKYKVYDEDRGTGWLRHVLVRVGHIGSKGNCSNDTKGDKGADINNTKGNDTGNLQIMLVLVTVSVPFPGKNNFIKAVRTKFPEITTIVQNINDKRTSMVLGDRNIVCYGPGFIEDEMMGLKFRISPDSFYQVNPYQTEKLYKKAIEYAFENNASPMIIDTYCGTGTIGMGMADKAEKVIGIELNASAVKDAIQNAKKNGIKNIEFVKADATAWMQEYQNKIKENAKDYVLIMDPPRSGSTDAFINAAANAGIEHIVYVSCNPETLARDLKAFIKKKYKVKKITPVDMFPWTEHVESCVLLERVSNRKADFYVKLNVKMKDYYQIKDSKGGEADG